MVMNVDRSVKNEQRDNQAGLKAISAPVAVQSLLNEVMMVIWWYSRSVGVSF